MGFEQENFYSHYIEIFGWTVEDDLPDDVLAKVEKDLLYCRWSKTAQGKEKSVEERQAELVIPC